MSAVNKLPQLQTELKAQRKLMEQRHLEFIRELDKLNVLKSEFEKAVAAFKAESDRDS